MSVEQRLYELCTELQSISGKNDKIAFIKKNKDDAEFLKYLSVLLNKLVVFGIQTKKLNKALSYDDYSGESNWNLFEIFEYLQKNNTGTDSDANFVASYIKSLSAHLQEWASASITKTLKLGVTAKSVNKALGYNLIVEFQVQRGKSYSDEAHKFKNEDKIITEKFDGFRGICVVTNGVPLFKSRQNKPFNGLPDSGLTDLMTAMKGKPDGYYEGEIIVKERHKYKGRQVLQETKKILGSDEPNKKLDWILFDYVTHDEFAEPETSRGYFQRKEDMYRMELENADIHIAKTLYQGKDDKIIYDLLDTVVNNGGEGLMANLDRPYKKDKTNHILKIKKKYTSDLRIIGFEEGKSTGKHKGTLGAFVLEYKGNTVNCGIMPDEVRHKVWSNQSEYLNTIIEVEHEAESWAENSDVPSISYPVFVDFRPEKTEPSYAHGED